MSGARSLILSAQLAKGAGPLQIFTNKMYCKNRSLLMLNLQDQMGFRRILQQADRFLGPVVFMLMQC